MADKNWIIWGLPRDRKERLYLSKNYCQKCAKRPVDFETTCEINDAIVAEEERDEIQECEIGGRVKIRCTAFVEDE